MDNIRQSPRGEGVVALIVRRPDEDARELLTEAQLDTVLGVIGDNWATRGCRHTQDGSAHPDMQVNIMNSRVASLIAGEPDNWKLAGDQLYIDLDLSGNNLPPGTRLAVGNAVLEVTDIPHTGCGKFTQRFGKDALKFVNSPVGRELNLRGINAKVVQGGIVRVGDAVVKNS